MSDDGEALDGLIPECTDAANAEAFANAHASRFRYLEDRETWLRWDGKRWREATTGDLLRAGLAVVRKMVKEAAKEENEGARKILNSWAKKSANHAKLQAMLAIAASNSKFVTRADQFDSYLEIMNVANGTLNLRTGELSPPRKEDLLTTLTPINYNPAADCPRWKQFLNEVFDNDKDLTTFVHKSVGYSLTGLTSEQCFFILHGSGENGKGRFIRQLRNCTGDAARTTAFSTLTAKRTTTTDNTPALAKLAGARLVVAGEPDEGVRFSESTIKTLTGEDEIEACAKYEAPFTYTPRFKIWLHCNHKPKIHGTDEGVWRRPKLIPFNISFKGRADKTLDKTLDAEAEGIFAWAVEGARLYLTDGLGTCKSVDLATQQYREESDTIGLFLEDRMTFVSGAFTSNEDIYRAYEAWCGVTGELEPLEGRVLGRKIAERSGITLGKKGGKRGVFGLRMGVLAASKDPTPPVSPPPPPAKRGNILDFAKPAKN